MLLLPVIDRELRASARHPFTYSLRMLGAGAAVAVCAYLALDRGIGPQIGNILFTRLHGTVFLSIWILVPLLTADCISRERREGTLPLLFLTPLKPHDIVLAKTMVHGLRALTLLLAVVPVLTIPFIAGGVSWRETLFSFQVNFSSVCLAIAAGLLASSRSRVWMRGLVLAGILSFAFLIAFFLCAGFLVTNLANSRLGGANPLGAIVWAANVTVLDLRHIPAAAIGPRPLASAYALLVTISLLTVFLLFRLAAWMVQGVWREEPPSQRVTWIEKTLCTPVVFQSFFHRWMRWELARNPIGWLERRTWSARLVMWSWFAVMISFYSTLIPQFNLFQRGFDLIQHFLAWLLVGSLASSAAGSFRRERETGVLELLVIAPLSEWQIIGGRVRGLWTQFLPATVLLMAVWIYCGTFLGEGGEMISVVFFTCTFLALPIIGLYYSLAQNNFISAFLRTLLVGVMLPTAFGRTGDGVNAVLWMCGLPNDLLITSGFRLFAPEPLQILIALVCVWRLHANLKQRKFALEGRES